MEGFVARYEVWKVWKPYFIPLFFSSIIHYIRRFPSTSLCRWKKGLGRDGGGGGGVGDGLLDNGDRKRKPASEHIALGGTDKSDGGDYENRMQHV